MPAARREAKKYPRWLIGLLWCNFIFRHGRFRFVFTSFYSFWFSFCSSHGPRSVWLCVCVSANCIQSILDVPRGGRATIRILPNVKLKRREHHLCSPFKWRWNWMRFAQHTHTHIAHAQVGRRTGIDYGAPGLFKIIRTLPICCQTCLVRRVSGTQFYNENKTWVRDVRRRRRVEDEDNGEWRTTVAICYIENLQYFFVKLRNYRAASAHTLTEATRLAELLLPPCSRLVGGNSTVGTFRANIAFGSTSMLND